MKSLKNKKGFTIVELVIVIAVIAILAAVMIPTFSNIVERANESAAKSNAKNLWTQYCVDITEKNESYADFYGYIVVDSKYYFEIKDGQLDTKIFTAEPTATQKDGQTATAVDAKIGEKTYTGIKKWTYTTSNSNS